MEALFYAVRLTAKDIGSAQGRDKIPIAVRPTSDFGWRSASGMTEGKVHVAFLFYRLNK